MDRLQNQHGKARKPEKKEEYKTQYLEKHAAHDDKVAALTKLEEEKAVLQKELQGYEAWEQRASEEREALVAIVCRTVEEAGGQFAFDGDDLMELFDR